MAVRLSPSRRWPACLAAACWAMLWCGAPGTAQQPESVPVAITQLADDEFALRERAMAFLWSQGARALPQLRAAANHPDAEVRLRVRLLLDKLELGLGPDSPPDIYPLVDRFRRGELSVKLQAVQELLTRKQVDLAIRLTDGEPPGEDRNQLFAHLAGQFNQLIGDAVRAGNLDLVEKLLLPESANEPQLERLAAFYLLSGRLEDRLTTTAEAFAQQPTPASGLRLFWLARAQGDAERAAVALAVVNNPRLRLGFFIEQGDFRRAAEALSDPAIAMPPAERLTLAAALAYRAGDEPAATAALAQLKQHLAGNPTDAWQVAEGFFGAGRPAEAIALLEPAVPAAAFYFHFYRHDYAPAFALAGVRPGRKLDRDWYLALPEGGRVKTQMLIGRETYARDVARALHYVGRLDEALEICELLRTEARKPSSTAWNALVHGEVLMGERQDALADAAEALATGRTTADAILNHFFPDDRTQQTLLRFLYIQLVKAGHAKHDLLPLLDRVLLKRELTPAEQQRLDALLAELSADNNSSTHLQLGELALVRGNRHEAKRRFRRAWDLGGHDAALRLADLAAEDQQWDEAARWYEATLAKVGGLVYVRYLHGRALLKGGRRDEGRQQQQLAELLALSPSSRYSLAFSLRERGLAAEATAQLSLSVRTASPTTNAAQSAGQLIGNLVYKDDPARAAQLWDRWLLSMLQANFNFTQHESYLNDPAVTHRARALGEWQSGRLAAAAREFHRVLDFAPGNIRVTEEGVLKLSAAGAADEAEQLFARCAKKYEQVIADYPQTTVHRRLLALLCARTGRRLDDALAWAQQAVALRPMSPLGPETLAEVHFARGELAQALAASQQAAALEPDHAAKYVRQQQRFTAPRPPAPPAE